MNLEQKKEPEKERPRVVQKDNPPSVVEKRRGVSQEDILESKKHISELLEKALDT